MPWNPNIPTVTNRVQDDLDAIRENFQHLDQLAERVDELQTVSELAPIANDLQAVSGLAPVANELQTVSGLAPVANELQTVSGLAPVANELQTVSELALVVEELQTVSELAPVVQALLDSRIVEMGSNSNGEYVRWENGWQVCFGWVAVFTGDGTSNPKSGTHTLPAEFASNAALWAGAEGQSWVIYHNEQDIEAVTTSFPWRAERKTQSWVSGLVYHIHFIAVGRWK